MKLIQLILEGITYRDPNFAEEWEEALRYPEFEKMGKQGWIDIAKKGYVTSYSKIKNVLGNVDLDFDGLEEPKKQRFQDAFKKGTIEMSIAVKFSDKDYDLVAGNTRLSGLVKNGIDPKIWIVDLSDMRENYADGKVNEIGDLSQTPYKFTKLPSSKKSSYSYYSFNTDSGTTYEVVFEREETEIATTYNMAFTAKGKDGGEFSASALTGENEPLKIMSTVVDITKKHIDKVDDADYINFQPTKGKQGEEGSPNTRAKLYKLIIKKNFPKVEVIADDDTVLVDLEGYYDMQENYADGKVKGKSRPGRVKKAGASCKGSVTDLRAKAKKYGGEKGKMYHWCANMKGGKN